KTINLTKQGAATALSFSYGKGNGLYSIQKSVSGDTFSRMYVYGAEKNLPANYRGGRERLQLPTGTNYIQETANVNNYGIIENIQIYDDIFPHRTGTVTGVTDEFTFTDSSMDFD